MTTENGIQVESVDSLREKLAKISASFSPGMDLAAAIKLTKEAATLQKRLDELALESEKDARNDVQNSLIANTKTLKWGELLAKATINGTAIRNENGEFELTVAIVNDTLPIALHDALDALVLAETVKSVKRITFSIPRDSAPTVDVHTNVGTSKRKGTGSGSNNSGRGWYENGERYSLAKAWMMVATADELAEYETLGGDGNKTYAMKRKVVMNSNRFTEGSEN